MKRENQSGQKIILVLLLMICTISTLRWNLHDHKDEHDKNTAIVTDQPETDSVKNSSAAITNDFYKLLPEATIADLQTLWLIIANEPQ